VNRHPLLQNDALLRAYRFFPHAAINGAARRLARLRRPRWLVQAAIRAWVSRDGIDLSECLVADARGFSSLEELFLRRLRPGARVFDPVGVAAPVDGRVVAAGALRSATALPVKGESLSLGRIVNGASSPSSSSAIDLFGYAGGRYAVLFLSPRGYHRIHMPVDGELVDVRWHAGRFFPQNERALARIAGVYEKNERAVLRLRRAPGQGDDNGELLLVLVGASVVGGIELEAAPRARWVGRAPAPIGVAYRRGDEIAHFTFGSTVIVLEPGGAAGRGGSEPAIGDDLRAGARLWDESAAVR